MIRRILPATLALGALIGSTGVAHATNYNNVAIVTPMFAYNANDTTQHGGAVDGGSADPFTYEPQTEERWTSSRDWEGASRFATGLRIRSGGSDGVGDGDVAVDFRLAEDTGRTLYQLTDARSSVSCPVEGSATQDTPPVTVEVNGQRETVSDSLVSDVQVDGTVATFTLERITSRAAFVPALILPPGDVQRASGWLLDVQAGDAHHRYFIGANHCAAMQGPEGPVYPTG